MRKKYGRKEQKKYAIYSHSAPSSSSLSRCARDRQMLKNEIFTTVDDDDDDDDDDNNVSMENDKAEFGKFLIMSRST